MEFLKAAFPWIVLGLLVIYFAYKYGKKEDDSSEEDEWNSLGKLRETTSR